MIDKLAHLDSKIQLLQKQKDKIRTHQALSFMKEAQKILIEDFTPEIALSVLKDSWAAASKSQKEEWKMMGYSFRQHSLQEPYKKKQTARAADYQNQTEKIQNDE